MSDQKNGSADPKTKNATGGSKKALVVNLNKDVLDRFRKTESLISASKDIEDHTYYLGKREAPFEGKEVDLNNPRTNSADIARVKFRYMDEADDTPFLASIVNVMHMVDEKGVKVLDIATDSKEGTMPTWFTVVAVNDRLWTTPVEGGEFKPKFPFYMYKRFQARMRGEDPENGNVKMTFSEINKDVAFKNSLFSDELEPQHVGKGCYKDIIVKDIRFDS